MSGVAALLRFPLPGIDDIEEDDIDIDTLVNDEGEEEENEDEEEKGDKKKKKDEWDHELFQKMLAEAGEDENDEGEEEDNS